MVEPLFFSVIGADTEVGSKFVLGGLEAKHAVAVRRITVGEKIQITDGAQTLIKGEVTGTGKQTLEILVQERSLLEPPKTKIYLAQALAKGDRDELAIQAATELGVHGVIPWQAERSISIWKDEKKAKGIARWQQIVQEAAKQSLRGLFPTVEQSMTTSDLIERLKGFDQVFVLDPTSQDSITRAQIFPETSIAVVVGPEGGVSDQELASFKAVGFNLVHLGSGILRTSTAGIAALSYLQAKLGDWN